MEKMNLVTHPYSNGQTIFLTPLYVIDLLRSAKRVKVFDN